MYRLSTFLVIISKCLFLKHFQKGKLWLKVPGGTVYHGGEVRTSGTQVCLVTLHGATGKQREQEMELDIKPQGQSLVTYLQSWNFNTWTFYNLRKQRHQVRAMCSNTWANGKHFTVSKTIEVGNSGFLLPSLPFFFSSPKFSMWCGTCSRRRTASISRIPSWWGLWV